MGEKRAVDRLKNFFKEENMKLKNYLLATGQKKAIEKLEKIINKHKKKEA
jgi:hypothetical protein